MPNAYANKVQVTRGGQTETLIDLTADTVTAADVAQGKTFHLPSGAPATGTGTGGGGVYQDQDGYLVLAEDGWEGVPTGNISITQNGTYDVTDYAGATVDVHTVGTYTATISGTGASDGCWVQVNATGTKHYANGDTFTFVDGDYLYICYKTTNANSGYFGTVTVNGVVSAKITRTTAKQYYTVTDPRCDMTIELTYGENTTVNLVTPTSSVKLFGSGGTAYPVGGYAFADVGGMTETDFKNYITRSVDFTGISWPDGITSIGSYAFAGCSGFNTASLPSTVNSFGTGAFYMCILLSLTSLPSGVTAIAEKAFYGCRNLALTSLPSGVTTINSEAFYTCSGLALTSLPSGVTTIGTYAFYGCNGIKISSLPSGLRTLGSYAFQYCYDVTISVIPSGVTSINNNTFNCCENITTISGDGVITTMGSNAFTGSGTHPMKLVSASFPNMAASSLGLAFGSTTAANACQLLEFVDVGGTKAINGNAFANCIALDKLVLRRSDAICTLGGTSAFLNTPLGSGGTGGTVYVPSSLIASYQTATNWKTLYNDGTITFAAIEGSDYEL